MMVHTKPNGEKEYYQSPSHKNAGMQRVGWKRSFTRDGVGIGQAIGTWRNYGCWGAGRDRDPNTGRRVMFTRVEGKIKGVVKRDGCVCFA